jgi:predicted lipid-binding transport protein (Tim44 family)
MVTSIKQRLITGSQRASAVALSVVMAFALLGVAPIADAKRFGGGGSMGRQATPPAKAAPPQAAPAGAAAPGAAAAAPARSSWMGPMVGLAAGLGLAALASHLGFGEELMSLMLMVLIAVVAFVVIRMVFFRNRGPQPMPAGAAGAMGGASMRSGGNNQFRAGLDQPASAASGAMGAWGQPAVQPQDMGVEQPSAQEIEQFLSVAKGQFTSLQKLWDTGDMGQIRGFCTAAMAIDLERQLEERAGAPNETSVESIEAEWLGLTHAIDDDGRDVEEVLIQFSGLIRESDGADAESFSEVWMLHKRRDNSSGWLLAGITQQ